MWNTISSLSIKINEEEKTRLLDTLIISKLSSFVGIKNPIKYQHFIVN